MGGRFGGGFGFAVYLGKVRRTRERAAQGRRQLYGRTMVCQTKYSGERCGVDGRREATGKGRTTWLVVEVSGRRAERSEGELGSADGANIDELAGVVGASSYRAREVDTVGSCEWVARYWRDCSTEKRAGGINGANENPYRERVNGECRCVRVGKYGSGLIICLYVCVNWDCPSTRDGVEYTFDVETVRRDG